MMLAVVDADASVTGAFHYRDAAYLSSKMILKDVYGAEHKFIKETSLSSDLRAILDSFKPVLKSLLGSLGQNMHFFVYSDQDVKGERFFNPYIKNDFTLTVGEDVYKWKTPTSALLPLKFCDIDKEYLNGDWNYCPYHGNKLKEAEK